jgi:membrane-associated protein
MSLFWSLVDIALHLDVHLNQLAADFGPWTYVIVAAVIFCETGLVVTPLLPGDSLLFAVGALAATDHSPLNVWLMAALLVAAAISGDAVNYWAGYVLGPKVFHYEDSRLLNKKHLLRTHEFYERHGGKTIVLARFIPIVRTFAPFVAGIARMGYVRFWQYNCLGGVAWVSIFLFGGYHFGNLTVIKTNFHIVIVAIVLISMLPMGVEWILARRRRARLQPSPAAPERADAGA